MFAVLASAIYGFWEQKFKRKLFVTLCYFLTLGVLWSVVTFCIGWMMSYRDIVLGRADPSFLNLTPLLGFLLGEIFAFFPWIFGLSRSEDRSEKD